MIELSNDQIEEMLKGFKKYDIQVMIIALEKILSSEKIRQSIGPLVVENAQRAIVVMIKFIDRFDD
jgi:hypothetical protein